MGIIGFTPDMVVEYVPEYGGNRRSNSPCVVGIRYLPYAKAHEYEKRRALRSANIKGSIRLSLIARETQRQRFIENVVFVKGVFKDKREVTDVAELYDIAPRALVEEILKAGADARMLLAGALNLREDDNHKTKETGKDEHNGLWFRQSY